MALLFCDGFDDNLYNLGKYDGTSLVQSGTGLASARNGNGIKLAGGDYLRKQVAAADEHATLIVGAAVKLDASGNSSGTEGIFNFRSDSMATAHVTIGVDGTGALIAYRGTTLGVSLGTSTNTIPDRSQFYYIEAKVLLSDTVGTVDVKVNGTSFLALTGKDTKNNGTKTVFDSFGLGSAGSTARFYTYDDFYACNGAGAARNDFLGDLVIETIFPTGTGNSTQLTATGTPGGASNWAYVDESTPNTTDYVNSATAAQKDTYVFGDLSRATGNILGVQAATYAQKSDSGSRSHRILTRLSSTDYQGASQALTTSWAVYREIWATRPSDSSAWTISDVNGAEFGAEVV